MRRDKFYLSDRIREYLESAHIKKTSSFPLMRSWQSSLACRRELCVLRWNG